jgi:hypothetical protein
MSGNSRVAGGRNGGISTMYKGMHNVVIYVVDKRSDTNGLYMRIRRKINVMRNNVRINTV